MDSRVVDRDRGARALLRRLEDLEEAGAIRLTVGVHADTGAAPHPSGSSVAEVASFLEMGTDVRAPIGFVRAAIDARRTTLGPQIAQAGAAVLRGATVGEGFAPLVAELAADMQKRVPVDTARVRESIEGRVDGEKAT